MSATGYIPGDIVYVEFTTQAFATGVATNADSTPTGLLNRNGTDAGAVTVTVTNLDTGRYKAVFTIPVGYAPGDVLNLSVAATVGGVSGKAAVWHTKLVAAGVVLADGVTHGGPAAVLSLERVLVESITPNEPAFKLTSLTGGGLYISSYDEGIYVTSENADVIKLDCVSSGTYALNIQVNNGTAGINIEAVGALAIQIVSFDSTAISLYASGPNVAAVEMTTPDFGSYGIKGTLAPLTMASFFGINSGTTYLASVAGSVVKEIADNAVGSGGSGGSGPTAQEISDQITADHGAGSYVGAGVTEIADKITADHGSGSYVGSEVTVQEIADQITADHGAGSYVDSAGGSAITVQEIADQITADHGVGSYVTLDGTDSGSGNITVNHDYGGPDNLAYKTGAGIGIDNAEILVYLKSDYDTGNQTSAHVKGRAATDVNGRWTRSLLLDAADYTFVYAKQGAYGPDVREVTVA